MTALLQTRKALVGLGLLALFALMALVGPWLVGDPTLPVGPPFSPPSRTFWLGTNGQGQDVFWRTVAAARPTLLIGFGAGAVVVTVGALVGATAGFVGGWVDDVLSLLINIFLMVPGLPLMVVIAAYFSPGPAGLALVLAVTGWSWTARVLRAQTLALRGRDFVSAATALGERPGRIVLFEILPNMVPLVVSCFIGAALYAIAALVGLEFLGIGDVERVTWGTILYWARSDAALLTGSWWTFVPAGLCVGLVGFALALVNSALDEVGNPRLRLERAYVRAVPAVSGADGSTAVLQAGVRRADGGS
jgi:peptide/nickel transport system permease protein